MAFQTLETFPATASFPASASFPAAASFPSNYDPDAVTYFASTGVTDQTQRLNISQFITGLKKNNIWTPLINGYTTRNTQQATGATVFGLKGIFNGTRINTPTQTANGDSFLRASLQSIGTTLPCTSNVKTLVSVANLTNSAFFDATVGFGSLSLALACNNTAAQMSGVIPNSEAPPGALQTITFGTYAMIALAHTGKAITTWKNGAGRLTSTFTGTPAVTGTFSFANLEGGNSSTGIIPFGAVFNRELTDAEILAFYDLYKATIGQGLSLP